MRMNARKPVKPTPQKKEIFIEPPKQNINRVPGTCLTNIINIIQPQEEFVSRCPQRPYNYATGTHCRETVDAIYCQYLYQFDNIIIEKDPIDNILNTVEIGHFIYLCYNLDDYRKTNHAYLIEKYSDGITPSYRIYQSDSQKYSILDWLGITDIRDRFSGQDKSSGIIQPIILLYNKYGKARVIDAQTLTQFFKDIIGMGGAPNYAVKFIMNCRCGFQSTQNQVGGDGRHIKYRKSK